MGPRLGMFGARLPIPKDNGGAPRSKRRAPRSGRTTSALERRAAPGGYGDVRGRLAPGDSGAVGARVGLVVAAGLQAAIPIVAASASKANRRFNIREHLWEVAWLRRSAMRSELPGSPLSATSRAYET